MLAVLLALQTVAAAAPDYDRVAVCVGVTALAASALKDASTDEGRAQLQGVLAAKASWRARIPSVLGARKPAEFELDADDAAGKAIASGTDGVRDTVRGCVAQSHAF